LSRVSGSSYFIEPELANGVRVSTGAAGHLVVAATEVVLHPIDDDGVALDAVRQPVTARTHDRTARLPVGATQVSSSLVGAT
jgi:hypothetical protein